MCACYEEAQAESFHKMLLAMSRDVRVILIKLADRLHNMRTLGAVKQHKKFRIAKETMDIYAPIASRLGLFSVYRELSDMSFSYMYPIRYRVLEKKVAESRMRKKNALDQIYHETSDRLAALLAEVLFFVFSSALHQKTKRGSAASRTPTVQITSIILYR